ncbi:hypothetical protein CFC21_004279 [Triticum aestivum]|uniref:Uncharacterized protein n=1 Tax=Triticum aestivum TaxID=4565 RepID=A0A3B5Y6Q6_WHEAT|nr:hypothetical protein CFC21_004272 [Triticum aestivum]KAF6986541.1 hypothetical protein CFC21_004279 [Triticum aestivum]
MDLPDELLHLRGRRGGEAAMAAVIGDDDLLREILLRLGFPAFLVHAALVSKRWLRVATDTVFLRRFRDRHPPRILGFYVNHCSTLRTVFVSVSEARELRYAVNRAGFHHCNQSVRIADSRNGRLLLKSRPFGCGGYTMFSPLCPARGVLPIRLPPELLHIGRLSPLDYSSQCLYLLFRDNNDGIVLVSVRLSGRKLSARVYVGQSDAWGEAILAEGELPVPLKFVRSMMIVNDKLYIVLDNCYICGLDFVAPRLRLFVVKVPDKVGADFKLSHGDDSGLFLIHRDRFHLSVWNHQMDDNGEDRWELVDRFVVHAAQDRHERFRVCAVSEDGGFVFLCLWTSRTIISVDLRSRKETTYEIKVQGIYFTTIFPLMTIWPPTFPTLNDEDDHDE